MADRTQDKQVLARKLLATIARNIESGELRQYEDPWPPNTRMSRPTLGEEDHAVLRLLFCQPENDTDHRYYIEVGEEATELLKMVLGITMDEYLTLSFLPLDTPPGQKVQLVDYLPPVAMPANLPELMLRAASIPLGVQRVHDEWPWSERAHNRKK